MKNKTIQSNYFSIFLIKNNEKISKILETDRKKFGCFFDMEFKYPNIFFINSRKQFDKLWQMKSQNWMVGGANGNNIFILDPKIYTKESDHKNINHFYQTITHEYAHIAIRKFCGHNKPKWLNEGLSCYLSNQKKITPPNEKLLQIFDYFNKSDKEIYNIGYFWTKFFIENFGKEKILKLLKNININIDEKQFTKIFYKIYKIRYSKKDLNKLLLE